MEAGFRLLTSVLESIDKAGRYLVDSRMSKEYSKNHEVQKL